MNFIYIKYRHRQNSPLILKMKMGALWGKGWDIIIGRPRGRLLRGGCVGGAGNGLFFARGAERWVFTLLFYWAVHLSFEGVFFFYRHSLIPKKVFKKIRRPHHYHHLTSRGNPSLQPKWVLCAWASGMCSEAPRADLPLRPSPSGTSGWPRASFLGSWGPLCSSGGSVFPACFSPLHPRPGAPGFCLLSATLPLGCFTWILLEDREMESIKNVSGGCWEPQLGK